MFFGFLFFDGYVLSNFFVCRCCFVCFLAMFCMLLCYVLSFGKISEVHVMLVLEKIVILVLSNDSVLFFCYATGRTCRGYGLQVWCLVMVVFFVCVYHSSFFDVLSVFSCYLVLYFCMFFWLVLYGVLLCFEFWQNLRN
jgi:hypothetical protein